MEAPENTDSGSVAEPLLSVPNESESSPMAGFLSVDEPEPMPSFTNDPYSIPPPSESPSPLMMFDDPNLETEPDAYSRAWGREESPPWYEEKQVGDSRIDSALEEAAVGMDLFGEGGISMPSQRHPTRLRPRPLLTNPWLLLEICQSLKITSTQLALLSKIGGLPVHR